MPSLTIRHDDGTTDTIPQTIRTEIKREIGKMRRGRLTVERSLAESANLEAKSDVIELPDDDNLRLVDIETGGSTWTLVAYSFEWDANTTTPTGGGNSVSGTDSDLITDFVNDVSTWSAGTITQQATDLTFVFNHSQPHEAIRRIEKNVPGEIQFRNEGTVDYVSRLGSDRSGSVELSTSAGTIEDKIRITERGRKLDGTHIRVLGAHEGEAQLFANLVPSGDPQSYENEVRYSTSRWSDSSDTEWNRFSNKDVTDQTTIEEEAAELGEELKNSLVEVKATVSDVDLNVGDTVQVVKSDADLDRALRVHRISDITQGATETAEVLLSTRTTLRTDESGDLRDIQRFNSGFQGASVWNTIGPVEQNVDSNEPLELEFYYPKLGFENVVNLTINSLPYRYYVSPTSHDHSFSVPDHDHSVSVSDSTVSAPIDPAGIPSSLINSDVAKQFTNPSTFEEFETHTTSSDIEEVHVSFDFRVVNRNNGDENLVLRVRDKTTGNVFMDQEKLLTTDASKSHVFRTPDNVAGHDLALEAQPVPDSDIADGNESVTIDYKVLWSEIKEHTHDVSISDTTTTSDGGAVSTTTETQAGVSVGVESTNKTASNVDVIVNGSTIASNIGSGTFDQTIDLRDEFDTAAQNRVEITSDSPGRFFAAVDIDAYKRIGQQ